MKETLYRLSVHYKIPVEELMNIYKAYWRFIQTTIKQLPLKEDLDEETFNKLKTNFNISNLGKLSCTYDRYKIIKNVDKRIKDVKYKENKTNS